MKTNIILKFLPNESRKFQRPIDHLRVKLDSKKYPYIIIDNEKHIIGNSEFPLSIGDWNGVLGQLDIVQGLDELKEILSNPNLTTDQMSISNLARMAVRSHI